MVKKPIDMKSPEPPMSTSAAQEGKVLPEEGMYGPRGRALLSGWVAIVCKDDEHVEQHH